MIETLGNQIAKIEKIGFVMRKNFKSKKLPKINFLKY